MRKRSVLLNSLIAFIFFLNVAPAKAQHSWTKIYGSDGDDRPSGIKELSNGFFALYGMSFPENALGYNYIGYLDRYGNKLWDYTGTAKNGYCNYDMLEVDSFLYFFGERRYQEGNGGICKLTHEGILWFDSLYIVDFPGAGNMIWALQDQDDSTFITAGLGSPNSNNGYLMIQRTTKNGKRLWYRYVNVNMGNLESFKPIKFFKDNEKKEYLVFAELYVVRLDSMGNMIGSIESAIGDLNSRGKPLIDVVQNKDGTYTSFSGHLGYSIQYHDKNGKFIGYGSQLIQGGEPHYLSGMNTTKEGGYIFAGNVLVLTDSLGVVQWTKPLRDSILETTVAQSKDGGFYGCALDYQKNKANDYDMFVFKTNATGDILTGVKEYERNPLNISITPNPSTGVFRVNGVFVKAEISLTDLLGRNILSNKMILSNESIDVTGLKAGVYILNVTDHQTAYTQKICIQNN